MPATEGFDPTLDWALDGCLLVGEAGVGHRDSNRLEAGPWTYVSLSENISFRDTIVLDLLHVHCTSDSRRFLSFGCIIRLAM